jgi:hypothetical protein
VNLGWDLVQVYCRLSPLQRELYRNVLAKNHVAINLGLHTKQRSSLLNVLIALRKACNHPFMLPGQEPAVGNTLSLPPPPLPLCFSLSFSLSLSLSLSVCVCVCVSVCRSFSLSRMRAWASARLSPGLAQSTLNYN